MEINKKKLKGSVVSDKMEKTIVVKVEELKAHPIYKKKLKWSSKYLVHDEKGECQIGDFVEIIESRPLSKRKKFSLLKIIKKEI